MQGWNCSSATSNTVSLFDFGPVEEYTQAHQKVQKANQDRRKLISAYTLDSTRDKRDNSDNKNKSSWSLNLIFLLISFFWSSLPKLDQLKMATRHSECSDHHHWSSGFGQPSSGPLHHWKLAFGAASMSAIKPFIDAPSLSPFAFSGSH